MSHEKLYKDARYELRELAVLLLDTTEGLINRIDDGASVDRLFDRCYAIYGITMEIRKQGGVIEDLKKAWDKEVYGDSED